MSQSAHQTARVTHFMEVDAQNFVEIVEELKAGVTESWGFRPGFNEMIALILARTLAEYPTMSVDYSFPSLRMSIILP
jgi:pyruvate/2-oxoglutarate dehydrogenase complex dihydrolipoamide acyltransferase (E2) component